MFKKPEVQSLSFKYKFHTSIDVLRLDTMHEIISGNKWFKLKEYIKEAQQLGKKSLLSFGGAYSNHIVATAAAAKEHGLKSIGIIRGEKGNILSPSLSDAEVLGMKLFYTSREAYKLKIIPDEVFSQLTLTDIYIISEGGYGVKGMEGAKTILDNIDSLLYNYIITAVGTGTTLAGLVAAANPSQKIIGISAMKNNHSLQEEINNLLPLEKKNEFILNHDYHFGGYAKYTQELISFMNNWFEETRIPSDFVYTGKMFYAVQDLIDKEFFSEESKLLLIHTGGLQGNRSLRNRTLIF